MKVQVLLSPPLSWRGLRRNQPAKTEEEPARPQSQGQGGHPGVPSSSLVCARLFERRVSVLLHLHVFKHVWSLRHGRDGVRCSVGNARYLPQAMVGAGLW